MRVVIPEVPGRFRIPAAPWVNPPVPESAVVAVRVPVLVSVPLIVNSVVAVKVPELFREPLIDSRVGKVTVPVLV